MSRLCLYAPHGVADCLDLGYRQRGGHCEVVELDEEHLACRCGPTLPSKNVADRRGGSQVDDPLALYRDSKVLVRVDFNVPQDAAGNITNDRRIRAAVPTLVRLLEADAALIVMSHLGRPKGDPRADARFNMYRVSTRLQELLSREGDF